MNIKYLFIAGWALSFTHCTQEEDVEPLTPKEGALSLNESDAKDHFKSGVYLSETEDSKGAIEEFTKAIELNPNDAEYWYARGKERSVLGDEDGAVNDFTKAIELDPSESKFWYERGSKLWDIEDLSKAIELDPSIGMYFRTRALVKHYDYDFEGACKDALVAKRLGDTVVDILNESFKFCEKDNDWNNYDSTSSSDLFIECDQ